MKHKKKKFAYRFERIVERNTVKHDLAQQSLRLDREDRDILHYSGTLAQVNDYDALCQEYAFEIRCEERLNARQRRFGF